MESVTLGGGYDFEALRSLNRDSDGSALSPVIDRFLDYSSAILGSIPSDWESYLTSVPADLKSWFAELTSFLDWMATLSGRPVGERASSLTSRAPQAQSAMGRGVNSMIQFMTLMAIGQSRSSTLKAHEEHLAELRRETANQLESAQEAANKVNELLRSTQAAAAATAATGRSRIFANEAKAANALAIYWLVSAAAALILLVALSVLFATDNLLPRPVQSDTFAVTNYILSKVLILGGVAYALTFATRQYSTYRHNATMNKHRSNALSTYRAIVQASRGENAHDIILSEAAGAIFGPQDSGFLKASPAESTGAVQVVQGLLRGPATTSQPSS